MKDDCHRRRVNALHWNRWSLHFLDVWLHAGHFGSKQGDRLYRVGTEGSGEGFPINRYDHVVGPAKALLHILFEEEAKPVLAVDSGP
jgi:hypothetical protein